MADESVVIEVRDGVDKNVARNLSEISSQARGAYQNVEKLVRQLNRVKPTAIAQFNSVVSNAQRQMQNAALSAEKLATQQQRTVTASAQAAAAQQRVAAASANADRAQSQAAASALRLEAAQQRGAAAADRQAAAQAKAAAASAQQARNLAANAKEVETITGIHDRFDAVLARNPKYQQAFAKNIAETGKKAGLARHELQNLSYQVNDVIVSLGSGQRPMQVFLQQGAQIGQIFGGSGVGLGAIFRQLAGIVGTLLARLLPFAAVVAAVLAPFQLFTREFNKGVDGKKLVADLKLTEDQLKQLKKSGEETAITFGDTFKATFQVIWKYATQYLKPVTDQITKWWNAALDWITKAFSVWVRMQLGMWLGLANAIKAAWNNIPAALEYAAKTAINNTIGIFEFGINAISRAIADSPLGKLLGVDGAVEFKLPRMELSGDAQAMGEEIQKGFQQGFKDADRIVTQFGKDVKAQALKNAQDRLRAAAGEDDSKGRKSRGFDRAKELASINAELDAQAKNMFVLATARDAANRADEIALRFAKEGQPLRQSEIDTLRNKIQALNDAKEVQQQFDRIYQNATGPLREYNASLAAADKLLKMGTISQAQYSAEVARAKEAFASASDPLHDMNKELDEQIKLLGMLGPQREVEQQVQQAINKALQEGKPLREQELNDLREKLKLVQQLNIESQIRDELQANSMAQQSVNRQTRTNEAIGQIGVNGFTGGDAVSQLGADNPGLQATQAYTQQQIAAYQDMYAQIQQLRDADVISEGDAMRAKFALFTQQSQMYLDTASGILGNLAQLRNSDNKKTAQLGKRAAIAQAVINTYEGATAAFKSAANIPYVGWILAPIAAGAAVAAGMAQVQAIKAQDTGFMSGGYTGNLPTNAVAGAVHGQEFVMNAGATSRIGVSDLQALQQGAASVQRHSDSAQAGVDRVSSSKAAEPVVVPAPNIRMINVSSEQEARNFAQSGENEEIIMNVMRRNGVIS